MGVLDNIFSAKKLSTEDQIKFSVSKASKMYNIPERVIYAQMNKESMGDPKALSEKGASGLMQLMPDTARSLGVKDIYDIDQNVNAGVKYLRENLNKFGTLELALAAYNAGPKRVMQYNGVPPFKETQDYVYKIMKDIGSPYDTDNKRFYKVKEEPIKSNPVDNFFAHVDYFQNLASGTDLNNGLFGVVGKKNVDNLIGYLK